MPDASDVRKLFDQAVQLPIAERDRDCPKTYRFPWDTGRDPVFEDAGVLQKPKPRGVAAPDRPKLFVSVVKVPGTDALQLVIAGRGFTAGQQVNLVCRNADRVQARAQADRQGHVSATIALPADFPPGSFTIEARGAAGVLTVDDFTKPQADDAPTAARRCFGVRQGASRCVRVRPHVARRT